MILERSAALLPRLVLCLSLIAATGGFAQGSELPPLVPAGEAPTQPAPHGEVFPREQKEEAWDAARFAGRLILQPPAGVLLGGVAGIASAIPVYVIAVLVCEGSIFGSTRSVCFESLFFSGVGLSASIGAGLGVVAVGYLLDGRARVGAAMGGALVGSAVGAAIPLLSGKEPESAVPFMLAGTALGATLFYALSDAFFPDPTRAIAPDGKDEDEDEYAWVLPMVSTTRTGGIMGGLVGRF